MITPDTPKSDAALEQFEDFCKAIRFRLEGGRKSYGDVSFEAPLKQIVEEIRQEVLDQVGWSFILYCRLTEMEKKIRL